MKSYPGEVAMNASCERIALPVVLVVTCWCCAPVAGASRPGAGVAEGQASADAQAVGGGAPGEPVSVPCPEAADVERRFVAPDFALDDPADVAWLGERLVLVNVASDHARRQVPNGGRSGFFAAIYEPTTNQWTELPAPRLPLADPDVDYRWRIVGRHLVVFYFSTYRPVVGGWAYNVDQGNWVELPWQGGPPAEAFLTGPYLEVADGNHWVFWSRRGKQSFHDGYILALPAGTWTRTSQTGAPGGRFARLRLLSDGRVLVVPVEATSAGVFTIPTNTWRPFTLPGAYPSTAVVAPDESAFAWVAWEAGTPARPSPMHAWVIDLRSLAVTRLASTSETFSHPNADAVYFDGQRVLYLDERRLFVQPRAGGGWQSQPLPFAPLLPQQAEWHPLCARRLLLRYHPPYWALDLATLGWQPFPWPATLPPQARHVLLGRDRVAMIGQVEERKTSFNCRPRTPCAAPRMELVKTFDGVIAALR